MSLQTFWEGWKGYGHFIGNLMARIVLTIFYFTAFIPFGLGVRLFSDPLKIKTLPSPFWLSRQTGDQNLDEVLRQF